MSNFLQQNILMVLLLDAATAFAAGLAVGARYGDKIACRLRPAAASFVHAVDSRATRIIVASWLALALTVGWSTLHNDRVNDRNFECYASWAQESSGSTKARSDAAMLRDLADQRVKNFIVGEGRPYNDPDVVAALKDYNEQSDILNLERATNPPPQFSKAYCEDRP